MESMEKTENLEWLVLRETEEILVEGAQKVSKDKRETEETQELEETLVQVG